MWVFFSCCRLEGYEKERAIPNIATHSENCNGTEGLASPHLLESSVRDPNNCY